MKKRLFLIAAILLLFIFVVNPAFSQRLQVTRWSFTSEKLDQNIRIALLSDLHNNFYGENQRQLVSAIGEAKADVVVMTGDMVDDAQTMAGLCALVEGLGGQYPVYYVSGNHECDNLQDLDIIIKTLRKMGVVVLEGESALLREDVRIAGMNDPKCLTDDEWKVRIEECRPKDNVFTVLLAHRPDRIDDYTGFDLTLCGHAHGGQFRFFGQGLWAPDQGLLPQYTSGFYPTDGGRMFVSRGLSKGILPRFLNRPELAIIEIRPEQGS